MVALRKKRSVIASADTAVEQVWVGKSILQAFTPHRYHNVSVGLRFLDGLLDLRFSQCSTQLKYSHSGHKVGTPGWDGM